MDKFVVTGCADEKAWTSKGSWSRSSLERRIAACTTLRGTELKRFTRRLLARELLECAVLDRARAEPAIHILESMGASVTFVHSTPHPANNEKDENGDHEDSEHGDEQRQE